MLNKFWSSLISGSDIRSIANDEIPEKIILTNEIIKKIALGFAVFLANDANLDFPLITVAIGHDSRTSALRIKTSVINALRSIGVQTYDCGLASTPAMQMANDILACTGTLQITASHLPANFNGIKFFMSNGGLSTVEIKKVLQFAQDERFPPIKKFGEVKNINIMKNYCEKLKKMIRERTNLKDDTEMPLKNLKIVVNAGNGVGGFFARDILNKLGANISGSIFLNPDGTFPNHPPNTENKTALEMTKNAVINANADLGIIFDADADRAVFIDSDGNEITRNKLIALASSMVLKEKSGATIVTDSVTSENLKTFIEKCGGKQVRFKRGYHNVINLAKKFVEKGVECELAIETSGHAAFKKNNFIDDGAYFAAQVILYALELKSKNKKLTYPIETLKDAKDCLELKFPIIFNANVIRETKKLLINYLKNNNICQIDSNNFEGIRLNFNSKWYDGWGIIRKSIHGPVLILYIESYVNSGAHTIFNFLKPFLRKLSFIDVDQNVQN